MFKELRRQIENDEKTHAEHKKFALSGIVVHDPNDGDLVKHISENFVKWAEQTGEHFLFITFVHPSPEWKDSSYCKDVYSLDKNSMMVDKYMDKEDDARTLPLLRDFLDVPQYGSYLLLTENLCSNSFEQILIDKATIEDQFRIITEYCNAEFNDAGQRDRDIHTLKDYRKLIQALGGDRVTISVQIMERLLRFTSITSKIVGGDQDEIEEQYQQADIVIRDCKVELQSYDGDDFEDRVLHLYNVIAWFLSIRDEYEERHERDFYRHEPSSRHHPFAMSFMTSPREPELPCYRNIELLDDASKKSLKTYQMILPKFSSGNGDDFDYKALTILFSSIVENELNLSVGQMIRWAMGIEMPAYYARYCRACSAVWIQCGAQQVNINRYNNSNTDASQQQGVPMGELMNAYKTLRREGSNIVPQQNRSRMVKLDDGLIQFVDSFSQCRNRAAHFDNDSRKTYNKAKGHFETFMATHLGVLYTIREAVRKGEVPQLPQANS